MVLLLNGGTISPLLASPRLLHVHGGRPSSLQAKLFVSAKAEFSNLVTTMIQLRWSCLSFFFPYSLFRPLPPPPPPPSLCAQTKVDAVIEKEGMRLTVILPHLDHKKTSAVVEPSRKDPHGWVINIRANSKVPETPKWFSVLGVSKVTIERHIWGGV